MFIFRDYYSNQVELSFDDHPFSKVPKHVFVICKFKEKWLLTKHKKRGLEFPGGKVEDKETAIQAAIREVKEETGAIIKKIKYIGQYQVSGKREQIIKNVYFARIHELLKQDHYYETMGPVLLANIPKNIKSNPSFSFIMKDDVLLHSLHVIKKDKQWTAY